MNAKRSKTANENLEPYNVCCFGVDYIGVITCCVMAYMCPRAKITVVDFKPEKVSLWNTKQFPSNEPGLEEILKKVQNKNLVFTDDCARAVKGTDIIFISVDVPTHKDLDSSDPELKAPNFCEIVKAVRFIAENSSSYKILVEKSPIPTGNSELIKQTLESTGNQELFEVISNPDFFTEGTAIQDLMNPDRIVIGSGKTSSSIAAAEMLASIYADWVPRKKILTVDVWSSEISKLCVSAFLAQKLTNMTAVTLLCERINADIEETYEILKTFSEHGTECLKPMFGHGGDSLWKDLMCLIYMFEHMGLSEEASYWREILELNKFQKEHFLKKILATFFNTLTQKKIAIWGITYQKFTPFSNEFPSLFICRKLLEEGAKIEVFDSRLEKKQILQELNALGVSNEKDKSYKVGDSLEQVASKANAIVCLADLEELKDLDYEAIYKDMCKPAYVFDGRLCLPYEQLTKIGFRVKTIGRKNYID